MKRLHGRLAGWLLLLGWMAATGGSPVLAASGKDKYKLDPNNNKLTTVYIEGDLLFKFQYKETVYPKSFENDGRGPLTTKPCCRMYDFESMENREEDLSSYYEALERDPLDRKALEGVVNYLGGYCARIVPFMDRYLAADGKPTLSMMSRYLPGLIRVGRPDDALKHIPQVRANWGEMLPLTMVMESLFIYRFAVDRDLIKMLDTLELAMRTDITQPDLHYFQEVFRVSLHNARQRGEVPWFLSRMEPYWIWFAEDYIKSFIAVARSAGIQPSEAMLRAADPLFQGADVPSVALTRRAFATAQREDSDVALRQIERAIQLGNKEDVREQIGALMVLCGILLTREDLERAYEVTLEMERLARGLDIKDRVGWALLFRGSLYSCLGDYRKAAEIAKEVYDAADAQGDITLAYTADSSRMNALSKGDRAAEFEPRLRDRAESLYSTGNLDRVPEHYYGWGRCLNNLGRHEEALQALQKAMTLIVGNGPGKVVGPRYKILRCTLMDSVAEMGRADLALGRYADAEQEYDKYAKLAEESQHPFGWWVWQLGKAQARLGLGDEAGAWNLILRCLQTVESQRASLKDFQNRRALNDNKYVAYGLAIDLALRRKKPEIAFRFAEQARARTFLDELGAHSDRGRVTPLGGLAAFSKTCRDFTAIVYFQLHDRLLAWVVRDGKAELVTLPCTAADVKTWAQDFHSAVYAESAVLRDRRRGAPAPAVEQAKTLYAKLIQPLADRLGETKRLCIIPHQMLHYIPFQALNDGEKTLVEKYEIFYAPSASSLIELRQRPGIANDKMLVLDPLIAEDPKSPFAKTETLALQKQHPEATVFLRNEATVEAFKKHAAEAGIIHVSSHGFFDPWLPMKSGLVMGPENIREPGILRAGDLYEMSFAKTHLVVMSACVSSVGDLAGGDEVTGLTRAFQVAGIPNVIGSLWPVENDATTELMTRFYEELPKTEDPVKALCAAQREMVSKKAPIAKWAAFGVTGDGRGKPAAAPDPEPQAEPEPAPEPEPEPVPVSAPAPAVAAEPDPTPRNPVAREDHYEALIGGRLTVDAPGLLANDTDANLDKLTAALAKGSEGLGELVLREDGSFTFKPTLYMEEGDTVGFVYCAKDSTGRKSEKTHVVLTLRNVITSPPPAGVVNSGPQSELYEPDAEGFIRNWLVVGPFPSPGESPEDKGFSIDYLKNRSGEAAHISGRDMEFPGGGLNADRPIRVKWQPFNASDSKIDFFSIGTLGIEKLNADGAGSDGKGKGILAYVACWVEGQEDQELEMRVGAADGYLLWIDHRLVADVRKHRSLESDQETYKLALRTGRTAFILVKVGQARGGAAFCARLVTKEGKRPSGIMIRN